MAKSAQTQGYFMLTNYCLQQSDSNKLLDYVFCVCLLSWLLFEKFKYSGERNYVDRQKSVSKSISPLTLSCTQDNEMWTGDV